MPIKQYGVLKGHPLGHLRDADDDHYQLLLKAGATLHRVAINVLSASKNSPSIVLFQTTTALPAAWREGLQKLPAGYRKLPARAGGLALDYVRSGIVSPKKMVPVPPDAAGADNDLKDKLEDAVVKAMATPESVVYAFGEKWGPESDRSDQYFGFRPGNGIHDIHMNQGNSGKYAKDNGVYQDGALVISYPGDRWRAFFFAFQSQTFETDEQGNPRESAKPTGRRIR
jgi:uncharacterized protein YukJ